MLFIVIAATVLQFAAGFMALRLIADSGKSWAWTLLSAGIFIMAFRRLHTLYQIYLSGVVPTLPYEILGLAISLLIFMGIARIAPLLKDMQDANRELAESEERYRTVAEFTHDWEYWIGPDGKYLYISPACERITGYPPEAFLKDPTLFMRIIHPADSEFIQNKISSVESMRTPQRYDFRIMNADGGTRWVAHTSLPVHSKEGVFLGMRASVRDIDHRKALEQDLRDSRALYLGLVENSQTMVLRLDGRGRTTFANQYAISHLGLDEDAIPGLELPEILAAGNNPEAKETAKAIEVMLSTGKRLEREIEFRNADGSIVWSEWVGSAIRREQGEISEFVCVGINVTRRKALDKLKEDVTRIIRHDLKSPLSGIIGIPRMMRKDDNLTPHQRELLRTVEDAGTIMLDLINQSLNLYKLETGTYEFKPREFDLLALLDEILQHIQIGHEKPVAVSLTLNGAPLRREDEAPIHAERPLVFTMLANLVRNGLESSEAKPVTVDVARDKNWTVSIHNSGVVPEEVRATFFDKYVTSGKSGGTGLGTYSARLIARQHGGDVTMRTDPREGTTVTVTLPGTPPGNMAVEA
jgi:PAS domain S-box-containing protein